MKPTRHIDRSFTGIIKDKRNDGTDLDLPPNTASEDKRSDRAGGRRYHPQPERIATALGFFGQVVHSVAPKITHVVTNTSYRIFPDSSAAAGKKKQEPRITANQIALVARMKYLHR